MYVDSSLVNFKGKTLKRTYHEYWISQCKRRKSNENLYDFFIAKTITIIRKKWSRSLCDGNHTTLVTKTSQFFQENLETNSLRILLWLKKADYDSCPNYDSAVCSELHENILEATNQAVLRSYKFLVILWLKLLYRLQQTKRNDCKINLNTFVNRDINIFTRRGIQWVISPTLGNAVELSTYA